MSVSRCSVSEASELSRSDAARVAGLCADLDLSDTAALTQFGERARLEVAVGAERLLAAVRSADIIQSGDLLRQAVDLITRQDPSRLRPRGLMRLFVGRRRRLAQVRARFEQTADALEQVARDLDDRAVRLARRVEQLDRLHAQARDVILDLDAYREAAASVLSQAGAAGQDTLGIRLEALEVARGASVGLLSLVRTIQNIDGPLSAALAAAASTCRDWREDWTDRLGLSPRLRARAMRPDSVGLYEAKAQALERLTAPTITLAEARKRRRQAETRMEAAVKHLAAPPLAGWAPVGETVSDT